MSPRVKSTSTRFIAPGSLATRSRTILQSLGFRASQTIQPPSRAMVNDGIRPALVLPSVIASARVRSISQPFDSLPPSVEFDEANDLPESLTNNSPPGLPTISGKRGRGKTRSCGVEKICNGKNKLVVVFDPIFNKPVDDVASKFASELCYLVRTNTPLVDIKSWSDVKEIDKQPIYTRAQCKFDIVDIDTPRVRKAMDAMLARRYTGYRNKLHTHYKKITEKGNNPHEHPYEDLSTDVSHNLCDLFDSEKF